MLLVSFVLLAAFTIVNIRLAGFAAILAGLSMNFAVIAVNGGMPVSRAATSRRGRGARSPVCSSDRAKHHLARPEDQLVFLADASRSRPREPGDQHR